MKKMFCKNKKTFQVILIIFISLVIMFVGLNLKNVSLGTSNQDDSISMLISKEQSEMIKEMISKNFEVKFKEMTSRIKYDAIRNRHKF